jgi:IS5 family transposase
MRLKGIRSLRELTRILDVDQRIRLLCLIEVDEGGYPRSVISRFTHRVGADTLRLIIEEKVIMLLRRSGVGEVDVVLDASFLKAWSIRDPVDNQMGLSDPDARVGRNGRSYGLGYKLHTSVEPRRILPLASVLAPANENEKRHASSLVERTRMVLSRAGAKLRCLIADSQYSSGRVRSLVEHAVIPYMSNQRCGCDVLRVDRLFRTHGPEDLVEVYRGRPAVEALFAFVKNQFGLTVNRVRGLVNVGVYALLSVLCLVLNREAAENLGRPDKALSPTFFNV